MKLQCGKIVTILVATVLVTFVISGFSASQGLAVATGTDLIYPVATTAAGGVYARYGPDSEATDRIPGYGVYPGHTVQLLCGVTDGTPVGPYNNTTWHFVTDLSNPGQGNFWLNDRYVDSPNVASQLAPNEPTCPNKNRNPFDEVPSTQSSHLPCTPILVIGARGSGNEYKKDENGFLGLDGTLSPLVKPLLDRYGKDNLQTFGVPYPAVPVGLLQHIDNIRFNDGYNLSIKYGVEALTAMITTQTSACAVQQIVLVGYSQGADVVNSTIPLLSPETRNHIVGVVTFGDPQFTASNKGNVGSYNPLFDGMRVVVAGPRPELLEDMESKTRSYCDDTDYFCNLSPRSVAALGKGHFQYAKTHVPEAVEFLKSRINLSVTEF